MPENFVKLASLHELSTSKLMRVKGATYDICLAYVEGTVYAIDDLCTHEDASLAKGSLHGHCLKCPLHGSRFDLSTGQALDEPAEESVSTYAVKLDGDDILVQINE
jgi:3-phenylpropionate/trans-cinnamate dioxygenase ferredoxin component